MSAIQIIFVLSYQICAVDIGRCSNSSSSALSKFFLYIRGSLRQVILLTFRYESTLVHFLACHLKRRGNDSDDKIHEPEREDNSSTRSKTPTQ